MTSSFGDIVFETTEEKIHGISDITRRNSLRFEEQEVEGKQPNIYVKGLDLEEISFTVKILSNDTESEIQKWRDVLKAAKPQILIIDNEKIGTKWLLTSISETSIDLNHTIVELSIDLKQFAGFGAKKEKENDKKESSKKTSKGRKKEPKESKSQAKKEPTKAR